MHFITSILTLCVLARVFKQAHLWYLGIFNTHTGIFMGCCTDLHVGVKARNNELFFSLALSVICDLIPEKVMQKNRNALSLLNGYINFGFSSYAALLIEHLLEESP